MMGMIPHLGTQGKIQRLLEAINPGPFQQNLAAVEKATDSVAWRRNRPMGSGEWVIPPPAGNCRGWSNNDL